ncbi:hypothetical protein CCACVL1_19472 [Corchorus capsularis]|uniref:Uncharacterized protein n=1 Tax=Corchorus capsularis TaxID=210143 RepID=A0A1R3HGN4_COCAP|nr:hypothetical protein CCACVL1_19472 [Corchorus capsularis]
MMSHSSEKIPSKHTHQGDHDEEHSNDRMSPLPSCSSSNKNQQQQESFRSSNNPQQEQAPDISTSSRGNRLKDETPSNHQSFGSLQKSAQENVMNSQSDNHLKEQQPSSVGTSSTHKNSEEHGKAYHGNVAVQNAPKSVCSTTTPKNVDAGLERTQPSSSSDCCCPCCCIL